MTTTTMSRWAGFPLFKVEAAALTDDTAARDLARRWVIETHRYAGSAWTNRLELWWMKGWKGEPEPGRKVRRNNFLRPMLGAFDAGRRHRAELEALRAKHPADFRATAPYPHAGGCEECWRQRVCNSCGGHCKAGERCTNGRCSACHLTACTSGGNTEPGHGYGPTRGSTAHYAEAAP